MKSKRLKLLNTIDSTPATPHQLEYANSLGIALPSNITKSDAKALTDRYFDEDCEAPVDLINYARSHGILCSSYIGYKFLHNLMFDNLSSEDLACFFCYCIYQDTQNELHTNLDTHMYAKNFYDFAKQYAEDFYFKSSLEDYYGEDLLTFGKNTITLPNGKFQTLYGGSKQTTAYKLASSFLEEHLKMTFPTNSPSPKKTSFFKKIFG